MVSTPSPVSKSKATAPSATEGDRVEQVSGHDRCVQQADERGPALRRVCRIAPLTKHRHQVEKPRRRAFEVAQIRFTGRRWLARVHGALDVLASRGRARVEAHRRLVCRQRRNVLDDVEIGRVAFGRDVEARHTLGVLSCDEGRKVFAPHAFDESEAPGTGELGRQVSGIHVSPKLVAAEVTRGHVNATGTFQPVQRQDGAKA